MTDDNKLVKVHFDLPEPDMGVNGESLWAAPVGLNLYELQNSPWHVRSVNWLDVVEAVPQTDDTWPEFVRVRKRSGHRTIHLYILDAGRGLRDEVLQHCNKLGATYEGMNDRMYALDFAPDINLSPALEYVQSLQREGLANWRINDCD